MEIFEITGFQTGMNESGVNYLQPSDSFQNIEDGYIYRQVLQSRKGFGFYAPRLAGGTRVMGIFDYIKPDGSRELLVADTNFLYQYNNATDVFDQLAFGGSMAGYGGFAISENEYYISGTAYPTSTNGERFIICGKGIAVNGAGSAIFFFDGTDVKDFTSIVDNPDYAPPVGGALSRANHVVYFNERLNFISPRIAASLKNQSVLYSGILSGSGNGDKFNVSGSGEVQFSTSEGIQDAQVLGQVMAVLLDESTRVLEITADAFNPYRIKNIPNVLGTGAPFSGIQWNEEIDSMGREGIMQTNGRQSTRIDNKIPLFTQEAIDAREFEMTYGGFDRINGQFLWSYITDSELHSTQDKVLVRNYEENTWSIYNQRLTVFGQTLSGKDLTWNQIDETAGDPSWARWDTTEDTWNKIGLGEKEIKTLAGDDLGFVYELDKDNDDYTTSITGITQASNAVVTTAATGIQAGDFVIIQGVEGMTDINNFDPAEEDQVNIEPYEVLSATPTSITIKKDTSLFDAYTGGGLMSKPIFFRAETIPLNPFRSIGRRFYVSHVEFLLDTRGGLLKLDVFANEETDPFIKDLVLNPSITTQKREWITVTVNNEADFFTFKFEQLSPSVQIKITSIRIHGEAGGLTSG